MDNQNVSKCLSRNAHVESSTCTHEILSSGGTL